MSQQVSFEVSNEDERLIRAIAKSAVRMAKEANVEYGQLEAEMDLTACHANGCPLKLRELAGARNADFSHDVFGIRRHLDRATGVLRDCFLPRFHA